MFSVTGPPPIPRPQALQKALGLPIFTYNTECAIEHKASKRNKKTLSGTRRGPDAYLLGGVFLLRPDRHATNLVVRCSCCKAPLGVAAPPFG